MRKKTSLCLSQWNYRTKFEIDNTQDSVSQQWQQRVFFFLFVGNISPSNTILSQSMQSVSLLLKKTQYIGLERTDHLLTNYCHPFPRTWGLTVTDARVKRMLKQRAARGQGIPGDFFQNPQHPHAQPGCRGWKGRAQVLRRPARGVLKVGGWLSGGLRRARPGSQDPPPQAAQGCTDAEKKKPPAPGMRVPLIFVHQL